MKKKNLYTLLLFLAAMIWGAAFVAQSVGNEVIGPLTFSGVRITMGGLVLLPVIALLDKMQGRPRQPLLPLRSNADLRKGGLVCGFFMFVATNLQQIGISYTSVGKAGFITSLYVALVPVFAVLFLRRRFGLLTWCGTALALCGMYFLCITEDFSVELGDGLMLLCAVCFSWQILAIDHYSPLVDGVRLSCWQLLSCGGMSLLAMAIFETPTLSGILAAWLPICYAGILSCGVAYTLQVVCQREVEPALASLVMSLESVFSVLFGWLLLGQRLSARELLGCALTFGAVLLVELAPAPKKKKEVY